MRNRPLSSITSGHIALLLAGLSGAAALTHASPAAAQADLTPPLPNVLLLIDTSGSMELMADGSMPALDAQQKCQPGVMNRWATLVSVLTGTVQGASCYAESRAKSTPFQTEYSLSGQLPYDLDYHLPFHRILSSDCTPGPGTMPATWPGWPNNAIKFHPYNDPNGACAFNQSADGLLDTFADRARFGLMTFDSAIDEGTGAAGNSVNAVTGMNGLWSYFLGWEGAGSPASGNPPLCATHAYEVGARNPAAPPWEGRLMPFGDPNANAATLAANNAHLQLALLAMRPYGATPLAGMLSDARTFLHDDLSTDPATSLPIGPAGDDYFTGGCRKTYIIVLSDGEPNLDLRKEGCATGDGQCPYEEPHVIAGDLATAGDPNTRVETFAVGFGLSSAAGIDCNTIVASDFSGSGQCVAATGALAACCNLARIAIEGGTEKAFFADDVGGLKSALSQVLGNISSKAKTRTIPAFASTSAPAGVQGDATAVGYRFAAQFDNPSNSPLWVGRLLRERYVCETVSGTLKSSPKNPVTSKGDNFTRNVNSNDATHPRKFFTVLGSQVSGEIHSTRSIRPKLVLANKDDGLGLYDGASTGAPTAGSGFAAYVRGFPEAFSIDPATPPPLCTTLLAAASSSVCTEKLVRWEVGEVDIGLPTRDVSGCKVLDEVSGELIGCELGSIYHSTPVVVGPPNEFLRDESYDQFALAQAGRPTMLYVATTDGQLHAFKVAANTATDDIKVDKIENNELWSFLPPAVLPRLLTTYNQQAILLDGQVVVNDLVLERTGAQAIAGYGAGGPSWRTILLAGGGGGGGYYFALDVTDPTSPEFLWQLSLDKDGGQMFGATVPTPAMATISLSENGGAAKDVGVAILAGGSDALLGGTCARVNSPPYAQILGPAPRGATRCWDSGAGRTLSIVRLDTGEVIRTFKSPKASLSPLLDASRITAAPFDSPLTGVPVPYPAKAGQIANRVYIGDADGTLWRVDLSKPDPAQWTVDMMWDAYAGQAADAGEPIQTTPIVSIDVSGRPVLLFSTGDQEIITNTTPTTHLWSITETATLTSFTVDDNWHEEMINGERVLGPISLFAGTAYFATFKPEQLAVSGDACTYGVGKLWGVDYLTKAGRLDPDPTILNIVMGPNKIVSGVAVTLTPSCQDTQNFDSAYFGGYQGFSGGTPGEYQLVYQVSGNPDPGGGGNTNLFTTKKITALPRVTTRIDSWAGVIE